MISGCNVENLYVVKSSYVIRRNEKLLDTQQAFDENITEVIISAAFSERARVQF